MPLRTIPAVTISNPKARLTLALSYLNAPKIAGGSVERATGELLGILSMELDREERFGVLTWLGLAYRKAGDTQKSREFLTMAGAVYPGNSWIPEILQQI